MLANPAGESIDALTDIDSLTDIDTLDSAGSEAGPSDWDSWRALLKIAIPLHRVRGTPYAVKQALAALGFPGATLEEGQQHWVTRRERLRPGTLWPAAQGWAVFRVLVPLADGQGVTAQAIASMLAAIGFFKNERSWLDSVWFTLPAMNDAAPVPAERLALGGIVESGADAIPALAEAIYLVANPGLSTDTYPPVAPLHDAHFRHHGITYGANEPYVADSVFAIDGQVID